MRRGDVVYLALTEARCTPSGYCHRKGMCARYLVKADKGRPVADYSLQTTIYAIGWCVGYMDAAKHREPIGAAGPRVHEAPKGLG